jgi:phosphatidate cytidylyltransferase
VNAEERTSPIVPSAGRNSAELTWRCISAVVLAPLAIGAVFVGGWPFVTFWSVAAVGVYWEWTGFVFGTAGLLRGLGILALAAAGGLAGFGHAGAALAVLAAGTLATFIAAPGLRIWAAGGVLYGGTVLAAPVLLRQDQQLGMTALLFLFAVVWATDIFAYFAGRLIGGPKLVPAISPKKTWAGALGGAAGAIAAGMAIGAAAGLTNPLAVICLALLLSAVAQAGDLFESAVKRRFGVKDAGRIIPGHGGMMDRLDGFLAAAGAAAILGIARGGLDGAARGLLVW